MNINRHSSPTEVTHFAISKLLEQGIPCYELTSFGGVSCPMHTPNPFFGFLQPEGPRTYCALGWVREAMGVRDYDFWMWQQDIDNPDYTCSLARAHDEAARAYGRSLHDGILLDWPTLLLRSAAKHLGYDPPRVEA